ncbi:MAG: TIGR03617 family F420-dependent LLM class oxidoreductase [Halieaceae bacterium]|jgi:probable F420-dependent oxidoreductase|nr:TIGR03617 family F420-dependent LLM class oxidoreductase [Halieaceae bacterium]
MPLRVESVVLGPQVNQYAGKGQRRSWLQDVAETATHFERAGLDGINTPEAGHDPFLPLTLAAEHTSRVSLGTNIAVSFPRSPMVTAQIAWDLQSYAKGRFNLGLGSQVKGHNVRRYSTPWPSGPGPRMREYILCMKAIFQSFQNPDNSTYYEGDHYQFSLMAPFFNPGPSDYPEIPLYLAAANTYMAALAGELGDGLRLHPISTFSYTRDAIHKAVIEGAIRSGRTLADIDLVGTPFMVVEKDEASLEKAKQGLRQKISFYASTRSYHAILKHHDWEDIGLELFALSKAGKWTEMPELISDDMLDEWAVAGTYDDFADKLKRRSNGVFNSISLDLPHTVLEDFDWLQQATKTLQS